MTKRVADLHAGLSQRRAGWWWGLLSVFLGFTRHTRHTKISCAKSDTDPIPRYDHYFEYFGVLALFFHLFLDDMRAKRARNFDDTLVHV